MKSRFGHFGWTGCKHGQCLMKWLNVSCPVGWLVVVFNEGSGGALDPHLFPHLTAGWAPATSKRKWIDECFFLYKEDIIYENPCHFFFWAVSWHGSGIAGCAVNAELLWSPDYSTGGWLCSSSSTHWPSPRNTTSRRKDWQTGKVGTLQLLLHINLFSSVK